MKSHLKAGEAKLQPHGPPLLVVLPVKAIDEQLLLFDLVMPLADFLLLDRGRECKQALKYPFWRSSVDRERDFGARKAHTAR